MARQIPLKEVKVTMMNGDGKDREVPFVWSELLELVLKYAPPGRGITMDDVLKCVDAQKPLKEAIEAKQDHVTFTEEQYAMLVTKLADFPFAQASAEIAEFGLAIREAKEIT